MKASGKYSQKIITIGMRRDQPTPPVTCCSLKILTPTQKKRCFDNYKQDQKFVRIKERCYPVHVLKRYSTDQTAVETYQQSKVDSFICSSGLYVYGGA